MVVQHPNSAPVITRAVFLFCLQTFRCFLFVCLLVAGCCGMGKKTFCFGFETADRIFVFFFLCIFFWNDELYMGQMMFAHGYMKNC